MQPPDPSTGAFARERPALFALAVVAAIAGLAARLWLGRELPLWVDESWTVMVATQPDWTEAWRETLRDANAPLYRLLMALWTPLAGASDAALRLPSLIFAIVAGLLPILWRAPGAVARGAARRGAA